MSEAAIRTAAGTGVHDAVPYRPSQLHVAIEHWQQFVLSLDRLSGPSIFIEASRLIRETSMQPNISDELVWRQ